MCFSDRTVGGEGLEHDWGSVATVGSTRLGIVDEGVEEEFECVVRALAVPGLGLICTSRWKEFLKKEKLVTCGLDDYFLS